MIAVASAALIAAACSDDGRSLREPQPDQTQSIITTSTAAPDATDAIAGIGSGLPSLPIETTAAAPVTQSPVTTVAAVIDSGPVAGFRVSAPWSDGGPIDARFTCTGENAVPTLQWAEVPPDAAELAVVVVDPDAENFVHWVVAGIDPGVTGIADGQLPAGAVQGLNGSGSVGWSGPCPPAGESHTYRFEVHALSKPSGLIEGTLGDGMLRVIDGDTLETALTIGVFPGS